MRQGRIIIILTVSLALTILTVNCANNSALTYNSLQNKQDVTVTTSGGKSFKGTIINIDEKQLILRGANGAKKTVSRSEISRIAGPMPIYDDTGAIITKPEIAAVKSHSNMLRYLVGGSALSFGASFFIGSLIDRQVSDEGEQGPVMWATAGVGTVVGGTIFSMLGNKKDQSAAIEKVREQRRKEAATDLVKEKERQRVIKDELKKLEKEREQQEKEMKDLKDKLKDLQ